MPRQLVKRRRTVMQRYAQFLANHPFLVLLIILTSNIVVLLVVVCTDNIPSFEDPQAGFVPRGTTINRRAIAWKNLVDEIDSQNSWTTTSLLPHSHSEGQEIVAGVRANHTYEGVSVAPDGEEAHGEKTGGDHYTSGTTKDFFCSGPERNYGRLIFCTSGGLSALELSNLHDICSIDRTIHALPEFHKIAVRATKRKFCPSWTLPNYVAAVLHRKACRHLTPSDVQEFVNLTNTCLPYYRTGKLHKHCWAEGVSACSSVPEYCTHGNHFYNIFYFVLADLRTDSNCTLALIPVWNSATSTGFYEKLRSIQLDDSSVTVAGMELGLKNVVFDGDLVGDTVYMVVAVAVLLVVLWMYTGSLFATLMNVLAVFFPIVFSYFLYVFVFRMEFFPSLNLLACVIMIAVGADALVIYARLWHLAKSTKNDGKFEKVVYEAIRHGFRAILVSSLTASAALFADAANPVVAIRCFSLFAGLTVLVHYIFVVTWLPSTVIIAEKWSSALYSCHYLFAQRVCDKKLPSCQPIFCQCIWLTGPIRQFCEYARIFFEKLLPCIVIRLRWIWIVVFLIATTTACFVVFYSPKFQLATSRRFHLWNAKHPFEQYHLLKHRFAFENETSESRRRMPLRFVWGVLPDKLSSSLDPDVVQSVEYDEGFDLSARESQAWMLQFCKDLKTQDFFHDSPGIQVRNCFVASFQEWLSSQPCNHAASCCRNLSFPLEPLTFLRCSREFSAIIQSARFFSPTKYAGPNFNQDNRLRSLIVECESTQHFSFAHIEIKHFYQTVESWLQSQLLTAPPSLNSAWFISDLEFFDLQDSLLSGTAYSLIIAFVVAFLVLVITTLNICVSVYAVFTTTCIMVVTSAILVLIGWELNVFESTVLGLGIGLSVDFTLHYSVSYTSSEAEEREIKTKHVIAEMSNPVFMSALTTFLAGALMMPSEILIYQQIGIFIMVIIVVSLLFSTIFFPALLAVFGPQGDFLQFHYPQCQLICCRTHPAKLVEKSMHASMELDTTLTTGGTLERENHHFKTLTVPKLISVTASPEPVPKVTMALHLAPEEALEETDSVGELGSVPTSRGPSRGSSLVRKSSGRGLFSWDYVMQKLPLNRHFSVAGSSVIYIDADVRSVASSDANPDVPAVIPNVRPDIPEVWIKRSE